MKEINETFTVKALYPCEDIVKYRFDLEHVPVWRQTVLGCLVILFLQEMFHFKIRYTNDIFSIIDKGAKREALLPHYNDSVDIYVKPMEIRTDILDNAYPIHGLYTWRVGFVLRRPHFIQYKFYSQPFAGSVWTCIYAMIILSALVFYVLSWWDRRLYGVESSFIYECMLAFTASCLQILPLQGILSSRRFAYITFIVYAYIVHCFYTSNLLSHLLSDTGTTMDLQSIVDYDYQIIFLRDMNLAIRKEKFGVCMYKNLSVVRKKIQQLKIMNLRDAMKAVIQSKSALITDYITLYPIWKRYFDITKVCQLIEIDLYSNVKHYFYEYTSKNFTYKEEFKFGVLRAKEAGLFVRLLTIDKYSPIACLQAAHHYKIQFEHTVIPMTILLVAYCVSLLVLLAEKIHYHRNRVWPYVN